MSDRLPPLTALRAFEAAARHMSFAKAAAELNVTPAALSFQIKSLEVHLGAQVFHRMNRAIELTEAGRALAPGASDGFDALNAAWQSARRAGSPNHLTVTSGPGFTSLWLAPRLFTFAAAHPEIDLRVSASLRILDFQRDDIDIAIRWGGDTSEGGFYEVILEDWATPMMTPALAERVKTPSDLRALTLIIDETTERFDPAMRWDAWFEAAGLPSAKQPGTSFNTPDLAVRAAEGGTGVLMGRISLTEGALRDGRLVMPFDLTMRSPRKYRLVCPQGHETRPQIKAFREWVRAEVAGAGALEKGRRFVPAS